MPVMPYQLNPVAPTVCLLTPSGLVLSEHGELVDPDRWPAGYRAWCSYDTARLLVDEGRGESFCWNGEEIRWRHRDHGDRLEWRRRPSDVHVLRLPFPESERDALQGLCRWRDWLAGFGASPTGTSGAAAWSLLRARLNEPLWTSRGEPPPLLQTLGGRQEIGLAGPGSHRGRLGHYDLPAAYAAELGRSRYGGRWQQVSRIDGGRLDPEFWARDGRLVFVRADVQIRGGDYGPLPRRSRRRLRSFTEQFFFGATYPTEAKRLRGVWSWPELVAAVDLDAARVVKVHEVWAHLGGRQCFGAWWEAVQQGRRMRGFPSQLAKVTGNALWGRFCMDWRNLGRREIRSRQAGRIRSRELQARRGGPPPAHDLAEHVAGAVRAELYRLMVTAGDRLVAAHTDGAWTLELDARHVPDPWRLKEQARRLDLIGPQMLRYWPEPAGRGEPWHVVSGAPPAYAPRVFGEAWERGGFDGAAA